MRNKSRGIYEFGSPHYPDIPADLETRMRFNLEQGANWYDNGVVNHYHDDNKVSCSLGGKSEDEYIKMWERIDHSGRFKDGELSEMYQYMHYNHPEVRELTLDMRIEARKHIESMKKRRNWPIDED